jgi:Ca-activated chloride channel family protein
MMLQRFTRSGIAWIVPLILSGTLAYAQFTAGVSLVEVYATVTDRQGELITNLKAGDFRVLQDGQAQSITAFAAGEVPLSVAVGVDRSFSMSGKANQLALAKSVARTFINALRPADQVMVVAIGSETEVVAPLSADHGFALGAVDRLEPWGTTPLFDATLLAVDAIQSAKGRRALVLVSDGTDRYSGTRAADLLDHVRRRDVLIYPIAIASTQPGVFAELATATGGRSFHATTTRDFTRIATSIARELQFQYLLGYAPPPARGASWHAIDVEVNRPGARVRARQGYFAP